MTAAASQTTALAGTEALALAPAKQDIDLFAESISCEATRRSYLQAIEQFRRETGFDLDKASAAGDLERRLILYVIELKQRGRTYSRINTILNAIQSFCDIYDIEVRWKKVRKYLPRNVRLQHDRSYTKEELRLLLEHSNIRVKAVILLLATTGMRGGAVPSLQLRHLTKMSDGAYKISVYEQDVEHYTVFTTLECAEAIDTYLRYREVEGEQIWSKDEMGKIKGWTRPEAYLIRKEFSALDASKVESVTRDNLARIITAVAMRIGLRKKMGGKRQEVMLLHGLRKFHNTALIKAGVKPVVCEMLLGHNIGLQHHYLRLTELEIYAEYKKAEGELTISQDKKLRDEVERLKIERADIEILKAKLIEQERRIAMIKSEITNGLPNDPQTTQLKSRVQMMTVAATYRGRKLTREQYRALLEAAEVLKALKS